MVSVHVGVFIGYLMTEFQVKMYCSFDEDGNMNVD